MSAGETAFYAEIPGSDGNTSLPPAVVEARLIPGGPGGPVMVPVAPPEIARGWPGGWYADAYGGWVRVPGPARMLSPEEHDDLIAGVTGT